MRIGINGLLLSTEAGYRQSGIDRYLRSLLSNLPEALSQPAGAPPPGRPGLNDSSGSEPPAQQDRVIVYANAGAIETDGRFEIYETPAFTANRALRIAWEQIGLPRAIAHDRLDLFHGAAFALPSRLSIPAVVTIHDLAFLRWPDQVPKRRSLYLSRAVRAATQQAQRVIAVSGATKGDIVELLDVDPAQIDVTPLGVDSRFHRQPGEAIAEFRQRYELSRPFVLAVGTREPRKNLPALIRAFARVKNAIPHDLVHAGGAGWLPDDLDRAIAETNLGDRLRFVDFVPHEELPLWYSAADCFVMPSLYEGFGLPLLEAMACGTPAIASNRSSLPEVAGDAAYLCGPDPESVAAALTAVLHDGELRRNLHEAGPKRARAFTWQRTAELTANSYRKAIDG